jgi:hypothetical protein
LNIGWQPAGRGFSSREGLAVTSTLMIL